MKKAPGYCSLWVNNLCVVGRCNCCVSQTEYTSGTRNEIHLQVPLASHISSLIIQVSERLCVGVMSNQHSFEILEIKSSNMVSVHSFGCGRLKTPALQLQNGLFELQVPFWSENSIFEGNHTSLVPLIMERMTFIFTVTGMC